MKCNLCNANLREDEGAYYWIGKKLSAYCKNCSSKVERLSGLPEVIVVPITPSNFKEVSREKIYTHPIRYSRKGGRNIAFYISQPVSAITHIAEVRVIIKDGNEKKYFLENLQSLPHKIEKGNSCAIQGNQNTTLKKLMSARKIKDIR